VRRGPARIRRAEGRRQEAALDRANIQAWVSQHVAPVAPMEVVHQRPWATVLRVPLAQGSAWFKACAPVQAFEPWLTARLSARWPDRVVEVLAHDETRDWLLLADAGTPIGAFGNPPQAWLAALPRYAELQRGEAASALEYLAHDVPDLRLATLAGQYPELLRLDLPLEDAEISHLRQFAPRLAELCRELAGRGVPETIQHDDLHHANLYAHGSRLRVLDWGDASIAHPFASLVVTFRFLEERAHLAPGDAWFTCLRDAYLEPWGRGLAETFALAMRVGAFARAIAYVRQRAGLRPAERRLFDTDFSIVLRRALSQTFD
jgi:hypothetical protein